MELSIWFRVIWLTIIWKGNLFWYISLWLRLGFIVLVKFSFVRIVGLSLYCSIWLKMSCLKKLTTPSFSL